MKQNIVFIFYFILLQTVIHQSTSAELPQVERVVPVPIQLQQTLRNQPINIVSEYHQKYVPKDDLTPETIKTITDEPNQFIQAMNAPLVPHQYADLVRNIAEKYKMRELPIPNVQSPMPTQALQSLATEPKNIVPEIGTENIVYTTRQTVDVPSPSQAQQLTSATSLPNSVSQNLNISTSQANSMDPVVLTQNVYQALEENFGRLGPILYDLITSQEGLGKDFPAITAYIAQRLGVENVKNALDTIMNILNQVDWRSRIQSLFSRVGNLRDNNTGLTLQDTFEAVRNIFNDPQVLSELRQRIRNDADSPAMAAVNEVSRGSPRLPGFRSYVYY